MTVPNTGLHLLDSNASHDLIVKPGSDLTADKTLTLTTGDADVIVNFTAVTDEFVLAYDVATNTWRGTVAGTGDFVGPAAATDNAAVRFDSTTGKLGQDSALIIADTTGSLSRAGAGGIPVQGTNTNDSAAAGYVGELIESEILVAGEVALTTATNANITSISLTAGDWDVWGSVVVSPAAGTIPAIIRGWISTTSATLPTIPNKGADFLLQITLPASETQQFPIGQRRLSLSGTTTVYLSIRVNFTVSTCGAYGYIGARRVR